MPLRAPYRRSLILLGALTVASSASALPAVGAQTSDPTVPTTTLAPSPPVAPAASEADAEATISVVGRGEGRAVPDLAVLTMGVEVRAGTVSEAQSLAADRAQAVIAAMRQAGVAQADLQTVGIQISPQYRYPDDGGAPVAEGYVVRNTVEVTVREVDRAGELIDEAVSAGGDAAVVSGVRFELSEDDEALSEAREAAWNDVRDRAEELAALAGGTLGRVLSIDEQTSTSSPPLPVTRADEAGTPVEPGTVSSSVIISARFELVLGDGQAEPPPTTPASSSTDPQT